MQATNLSNTSQKLTPASPARPLRVREAKSGVAGRPIKSGLKEKYLKEILPKLKKELSKSNVYKVPALEKISLNTGFGKLAPDAKGIEQIMADLAKISGQKPASTKARKAIAAFKTRQGQIIGAKVTLRGTKMYDFFEKLVTIVFPRLRDFRGVSNDSFDKQGNYTLGFRELNVFPEIEYSRTEKPYGVELTIKTTAADKTEAKALLTALGMPFKKDTQAEEKERVKVEV